MGESGTEYAHRSMASQQACSMLAGCLPIIELEIADWTRQFRHGKLKDCTSHRNQKIGRSLGTKFARIFILNCSGTQLHVIDD